MSEPRPELDPAETLQTDAPRPRPPIGLQIAAVVITAAGWGIVGFAIGYGLCWIFTEAIARVLFP